MDEHAFRHEAEARGYGGFEWKDYPPDRDGPLHGHDFSVMLLVTEGDFWLDFENEGRVDYRPGEVCELRAGTVHTERAGPNGARVLLSRRFEAAAHASVV